MTEIRLAEIFKANKTNKTKFLLQFNNFFAFLEICKIVKESATKRKKKI